MDDWGRAVLRELFVFVQMMNITEYADLIDELLKNSAEDYDDLLDCAMEYYAPVCAYLDSVRRVNLREDEPADDSSVLQKPYDFG